LLARPGNDEIQLDLFLDYASNVALYPKFQAFFRERQLPLLAAWGRMIHSFCLPEQKRSLATNLNAVIQFFDTGHLRWKLT